MEDFKQKAEELKKQGNEAIKKNPDEAIQLYSEAIGLDPDNHVLYGNRSLAFKTLERYIEALRDAEKAIELKPDWSKGHVRKAAVLMCQSRYADAGETYKRALELDPDNEEIKQSLAEAEAKQMDVMNPFAARDALDRLRANEKTKEFMKDEQFRKNFSEIAKDPQNLTKYMGDKRMLMALAVLLDVDIPTEAINSTHDPLVEKSPPEGTSVPQPDLTGEAPPTKKKQPQDELDEQLQAAKLSENQQQAVEEKEKGNAAYKKKEFETALAHYDKAIELDPTNVTFLNNKAAVFFEQGDWEQCLKTCDEAVEKGREVRADFKLIAKALARMGNAYYRQEKWEEAVKYFDKSLTEHRNPDIVAKKNEAKKKFDEQQRLAYIDPQKSLEAKDKGNELFKKGDFPGAISHYNEAIKRNPENAKIYSNRAACYSKLLEPQLAVKDCDECIRLDPTFIKGYIRKGNALLALKDTVKAMQAFEKAQEIDPKNAEAKAGLEKCIRSDDPEERRKRAMQDPEVQKILRDPAMQLILQQMQSTPEAIRDHLKNPEIAAKLQKLMEAGFVSIR